MMLAINVPLGKSDPENRSETPYRHTLPNPPPKNTNMTDNQTVISYELRTTDGLEAPKSLTI